MTQIYKDLPLSVHRAVSQIECVGLIARENLLLLVDIHPAAAGSDHQLSVVVHVAVCCYLPFQIRFSQLFHLQLVFLWV